MTRKIPAAAIPAGSIVRLPQGDVITIDVVTNSTPRPGKITWYYEAAQTQFILNAAMKIEVIKFPQEI